MISVPRSDRLTADAVFAPVAVVVLGCATVATIGAAAAQLDTFAIVAAGLAAMALLFILAGAWIDPFGALVVTLPLPAVYAAGDLRLAPALPLTAIVLVAWFLHRGPSARRISAGALPSGVAFTFLFVYALAGVLSTHRGAAVREVLNLGLIGALTLVATDLFSDRPARAKLVAHVIAGTAGCVGFLGVLETIGIIPGAFPEGSVHRAALGFGQPNGLGMFLALSLPFAVHVRRTTRAGARTAATVVLALTIGGLAGTFSRGSWLSVLTGATVLVMAGELRLVLRVLGGALVAGILADIATGGTVRNTVAGTLTDWSVAQRAALMLAGVRLFLEHPVLGAGPGSFAVELNHLGTLVPRLTDMKATPHNAYIQVAAESGIVGLSAFIALLVALLRRALAAAREPATDATLASLRRAALWTLAIACAEGMVEWPLSHGHAQIIAIAVAVACTGTVATRRARDTVRLPAPMSAPGIRDASGIARQAGSP